MRLIITRHGETEENKKKIFQGHLPGKLSKLGIEQIQKLALRLKNERIDVIYSSDLARAANTAKEIGKHHKETPIHFVKELREKDLGDYSGKSWHDVASFDELINSDSGLNGVESKKDTKIRVRKLLDTVFEKYSKANVLFVGHNGVNKVLIRMILEEANLSCNLLGSQRNTAVNIFEIREDKNHKLETFNCAKHLDSQEQYE